MTSVTQLLTVTVTKTSIKTTIKTIIYTFTNRIATNMTLHNKCLFCCFKCATLIITLSHYPSCLTICWFRPINAYSAVIAYKRSLQVQRKAPEKFFYSAPSLFKGAPLSGGAQCMFGRAHLHCFVRKTGLQIKPL